MRAFAQSKLYRVKSKKEKKLRKSKVKMAQMVKNLPAMQETQVQSLGQEDSPEKGMETQSSILAWRIPWPEKPDGLQSMRSYRVRQD